jgi:CheY-like chemotaxis protein
MLVDDDPDIRFIAELALQRVGELDVTLAASGADALARLDGMAQLPDVFLLDVTMPEMDGPALIKALRADPRWAPIPVIFLTARVQEPEIRDYVALGAAGVITKPFDPVSLPALVREIVDGPAA